MGNSAADRGRLWTHADETWVRWHARGTRGEKYWSMF